MCITDRFVFFLKQLSLPAEFVNITFCREKLLKTAVVDELAVVGYITQLVEEIKSLKVSFLLVCNRFG